MSRPGAYFCPSCVEADLVTKTRSYWRRSHQTPGLFWCPTHGSALGFVADESCFLRPPDECIDGAKWAPQDVVDAWRSHAVIARFHDICEIFMQTKKPWPVNLVRAALRERAATFDLRMYAGPPSVRRPRRLLSDMLADSVPADWLGTLLPAMTSKPAHTILPSVDGVLWMKAAAAPTFVYALAGATLFNSADELMAALGADRPIPSRRQSRRRVDMSYANMRKVYVEHGGQFSRIRKALPEASGEVIGYLRSVGLVHVDLDKQSPLYDAAVKYYLEGQPFEVCCQVPGLNPTLFDSLVRRAGQGLALALADILSKQSPSTRPRARTQQAVWLDDVTGAS